jgi:hypothetical protein
MINISEAREIMEMIDFRITQLKFVSEKINSEELEEIGSYISNLIDELKHSIELAISECKK